MSKPTLSPARLAEFLKRYPHEPNKQLAADFGITPHKAGALAFNNGVKKSASTIALLNGSTLGIAIQVEAAIQAAGASGLDRAEAIAALPHLREDGVCNALRTLAHRGKAHQAGPRRQFRWFANVADALAHNSALAQAAWAASPVVSVPKHRGPAHAAGEAIETADTKRSECLAPAPPELPKAARHFSAQRPGQYHQEASSWVNAITQR